MARRVTIQEFPGSLAQLYHFNKGHFKAFNFNNFIKSGTIC